MSDFLDLMQSKTYLGGLFVLVCISAIMCWRLFRSLNDAEADREAKEAEDFAQHLAHLVHTEQYAICPETERQKALEAATSICRQLERQT
jgi:hypothetical protein